MYNSHFGFSEAPFSISPDPNFLYMSERHRDALAHLIYGAGENGGFVLLTGEVGTGKTTLIRTLLAQEFDDVDVALCLHSGLTVTDFIASILDDLHIPRPDDTSSLKPLVDALNEYLLDAHANGRQTVIIIDEAQNLSREVLEQVRLLTNLETDNQKLLRIILVGQEELFETIEREDLRQLSQRITTRYHLTALNESETKEYVLHRIKVAGGSPSVMTAGALKKVYRLAHGVPRLTNVLCDRALLTAFNENTHVVSPKHIQQAATEILSNYHRPQQQKPQKKSWLEWLANIMILLGAVSIGYGFKPLINKGLIKVDHFIEEKTGIDLFDIEDVSRETPAPRQTKTVETKKAVKQSTEKATEKTTEKIAANQHKDDKKSSTKIDEVSKTTSKSTDNAEVKSTTATANNVGKADETTKPTAKQATITTASTTPIAASPSNENKPQVSATDTPPAPPVGIVTPNGSEVTLESTKNIAPKNTTLVESKKAQSAQVEKPPVTVKNPSKPKPKILSVADLRNGAGNEFAGMLTLADKWKLNTDIPADKTLCGYMESQKMRCVEVEGGFPLLSAINRPVLLEILREDGRTAWLPITGMSDNSLSCVIDGKTENCPFGTVAQTWTGRMKLLLKKPNVSVQIRPGFEGSQVKWLRQRVAIFEGKNYRNISDSSTYDEALVKRVKQLQGKYGLVKDGIVGNNTLLHLYNVATDSKTPMLRK